MKYRDRDWLRREYVDKRRTTYQIADNCDVSAFTIQRWLKRHNIPIRDRSECQIYHRSRPPKMTMDGQGYERFLVFNGGEPKVFRVHQLVAIADGADPYDIFGGGYDVHHKNGIPWDNRPENLKVMKHDEHRRYHAERQ